jgi:hypothetical protein
MMYVPHPLFKGQLCGAFFGLPGGGTFNNSEEFEDDWGSSYNVDRVQGLSGIHSATIAIHHVGVSIGYYQFGELKRSAKVSEVYQGYDLSFGRAFGNLEITEKFCVENWDLLSDSTSHANLDSAAAE